MISSVKKNKIKTLWFSLSVFFSQFLFGYAQMDDANKLKSPIKAESLAEFFSAIVDTLIQLGVVVSALGIMYGGFLLVSAQGDEEKVANGRKTITWAMVGTAVLLGAKVIFTVIKGTVDQLT